MKKLSLIMFSYLITTIMAQSQEMEFGAPDSSIPELSQVEYLLGEWEVKMELRQEDGSFKKLDTIANVKAFFHDDGKSFQTIFTTNKGGFTTDIRTYNVETEKWQVMFMNASAQRWHEFEAGVVDGKMTTHVLGGYSGKEEYDVKVVDDKVSENSFTKEVFNSQDGGQNWQKTYIMNFVRLN